MKKHRFDLFRAWLRSYFKHPLENIRQAKPIVPGRLYTNFGNICKAVRYRPHEQALVNHCRTYADHTAIPPNEMMEVLRRLKLNKETADFLKREMELNELPARCSLCDFHRQGIPCPIYNELADGSTVCDTHRYIIIKRVKP